MRRKLRSSFVIVLVATLTINPATACHYCGMYWGGYSGSGYYESRYYDSGYDCGGCGSGCSSDGWYESSCCDEGVVSDCCGGCEETVQEAAPGHVEPSMKAPEPPAHEEMPSTVNRHPAETAPVLPPQPMPSTTETEMQAMPPVEPSVEEPAPPMEETTPPAEPSNDLFSEPAAPTEEPAAPAETDDLFNAPAEEPSAPAAEPSAPAETDDLFGTSEEPATDATPETPAEGPTSEPSGDDLFAPETEETTPPAEEEKVPADEKATDDDDLFGDSGTILRMPGGLASSELRRWVDNTGQYSCRGRLIRVLEGKVQLRKENGHTTTVPFSRLCEVDLEFVQRQASAQRAEAVSKTAQAAPNWSN